MQIQLPKEVKKIIEIIEAAGFEAYAVGGCIRDSLLGRIPNDWDITTSAKPEEIKALFYKTIDTGIEHGTVTVRMYGENYEVTTYRIDGEYEDARHPKKVTFTASLTEDLRRRDFTINAMAYNDRCGLVDEFNGMRDLRHKIIRAVGEPEERFTEDALRMMRAVRFSAQLGYEIEKDTAAAIRKLAPNLKKISAERIQAELVKLVSSAYPEKMRDLYETGITAIILPEFDEAMKTPQNNPHHCYTVGEHIIQSMKEAEEDKTLRLTMLFHDIGKPQCRTTDEDGIDHFHGHAQTSEEICKKTLRALKFDNDTIRTVCSLVMHHDYHVLPERKYVRRAMNRIGKDNFLLLIKVKQADLNAQSDYQKKEKQERLTRIEELCREVLQKEECVDLKTLQVTGCDLIEWGMKPGKEIGDMLQRLLDAVIEDPSLNQKDRLQQLFESCRTGASENSVITTPFFS